MVRFSYTHPPVRPPAGPTPLPPWTGVVGHLWIMDRRIWWSPDDGETILMVGWAGDIDRLRREYDESEQARRAA